MAKRQGELTVTEAAELLEIHRDTVRLWAKQAISGQPSRIPRARRDVVGHYYLLEEDVRKLKDAEPTEYY